MINKIVYWILLTTFTFSVLFGALIVIGSIMNSEGGKAIVALAGTMIAYYCAHFCAVNKDVLFGIDREWKAWYPLKKESEMEDIEEQECEDEECEECYEFRALNHALGLRDQAVDK